MNSLFISEPHVIAVSIKHHSVSPAPSRAGAPLTTSLWTDSEEDTSHESESQHHARYPHLRLMYEVIRFPPMSVISTDKAGSLTGGSGDVWSHVDIFDSVSTSLHGQWVSMKMKRCNLKSSGQAAAGPELCVTRSVYRKYLLPASQMLFLYLFWKISGVFLLAILRNLVGLSEIVTVKNCDFCVVFSDIQSVNY